MLPRLPRLALVRLVSLLLLATIGLQASEPVREIGRDRGSAFSSATTDVAVAAKGRPGSGRPAVELQPPTTRQLPVRAACRPCATEPAALPDSTGPPAHAILVRQPAPRAPPSRLI